MYKIAFDIMGSDNGPSVAIESAIRSLKKYNDLIIVLYGDKELIEIELKKYKYDQTRIEIFNCSEYIKMTDGILDIRRKKDSSMVRSLESLQKKEVDGMITASSTSSFVAGCHFILKELDGVKRPGFMPVIPTILKNKVTLILDVGANLENSSEDLYNFALMASSYCKANYGVQNPLVGLLNVGTEPKKGPDFLKEAYELLDNSEKINFYGNIEGREITSGICDVIVCDGYAGNIALKSFEGMGKNLMGEIKKSIKKTLWRKISYVFGLRGAFNSVRKKFDYKNYAGAIMLGVNGIAFKSHGSSDIQSFCATIRMTYDAIKNNALNNMVENLK